MAHTFSPRWKTHEITSAHKPMPEHSVEGVICVGSGRPVRNIEPEYAPDFGQIGYLGRCSACELPTRYKPRTSMWMLPAAKS